MGLFSIKQAKPKKEKAEQTYSLPTTEEPKVQEQENQDIGQIDDNKKSLNDWD